MVCSTKWSIESKYLLKNCFCSSAWGKEQGLEVNMVVWRGGRKTPEKAVSGPCGWISCVQGSLVFGLERGREEVKCKPCPLVPYFWLISRGGHHEGDTLSFGGVALLTSYHNHHHHHQCHHFPLPWYVILQLINASHKTHENQKNIFISSL